MELVATARLGLYFIKSSITRAAPGTIGSSYDAVSSYKLLVADRAELPLMPKIFFVEFQMRDLDLWVLKHGELNGERMRSKFVKMKGKSVRPVHAFLDGACRILQVESFRMCGRTNYFSIWRTSTRRESLNTIELPIESNIYKNMKI